MIRCFLSIVLFCANGYLYAQKHRKVLDVKTGLPISYVTIKILNSTKGIVGSADGSFLLSIQSSDSILFSSAGYEKLLLSGKEIDDTVYMSTKIIELKPVTILNKIHNRTIRIGNEKKITKGDIVWGSSILENHDEFAQKIILPDSGTHLQIKKIFIPVKKNGKCTGPLLLRIYFSDSLIDQPGIEILSQITTEKNVLIKKNELIIDVSSNNIFFDANTSFFISVTWPHESFALKCKIEIPMSKISSSQTYSRTLTSYSFQWFPFGKIKNSEGIEFEVKTFMSIEADVYK